MQKISLDKKLSIIADRKNGMSYGKIALKYLVSITNVYYTINPEKEAERVEKLRIKKDEELNKKTS